MIINKRLTIHLGYQSITDFYKNRNARRLSGRVRQASGGGNSGRGIDIIYRNRISNAICHKKKLTSRIDTYGRFIAKAERRTIHRQD